MLAAIALSAMAFTSCGGSKPPIANNEELELRVKKDDMMQKLDAGVADYEAKYKR
jgi:hypothetical protein